MFCVPIASSNKTVPQVDKVTLAGVGKRPSIDPGVDKYDYLDSASSLNSVSDPALMFNLRPAKVPVNMGTNGGNEMLDIEADTPMGPRYANLNGIANIKSMSLTVDDCKRRADGSFVWMDTRQDDAIYLIDPKSGQHVRYGRQPNGLYGAKIDQSVVDAIAKYKEQLPVQ